MFIDWMGIIFMGLLLSEWVKNDPKISFRALFSQVL
jgi:hypothetical protein